MNVAVIGCGVRGSTVAALLAGANVEELSLIDGASVEEEDLGSHALQFKPDLFANKAEALTAKLGLINPAVLAQPFPAFVTADNVMAILTGADCAVDCSNDEHAAPLIDDACSELGIPIIAPPEAFEPGSASAALATAVGAMQADLALRFLGGDEEADEGTVLRVHPSILGRD